MSVKSLARKKKRAYPYKFIVREDKGCLIWGSVGAVLFGVLSIAGALSGELEAWELLIFVIGFLMGIYCLLSYDNRRLEVNGEQITCTNAFGKQTRFQAEDIADIVCTKSRFVAYTKLKNREGKVLARFEDNMHNCYLLEIYLNQHMQKKEGN